MTYHSILEKNFTDWQTKGFCDEAVALNSQIRSFNSKITDDYFDTSSPSCHAGKLDSAIVAISHNPKRNKDSWGLKCKYADFNAYLYAGEHFGSIAYGVNSPRTHKSAFDQKQVRFFRPFGVFPFTGDKYHDLELLIDNKLQLELVPFGSPKFEPAKIGVANLRPYVERLLEVIALREREYLIFCGDVFEEALKEYIVSSKTHLFQLLKVDGKFFDLFNGHYTLFCCCHSLQTYSNIQRKTY